MIAGTPVAVRLAVTPKHGVKYEMFQESHPAIGYALSVNDGQWQLQQELNSPQLSQNLIEAILPEMVDLECTEGRLSAPDDRGLQWSGDQESYLRIKGRYVQVTQDQNSVNRYRLHSPDNQQAMQVIYNKSRFCLPQEWTQQVVNRKGINLKTKNKQRKKIESLLKIAEQNLKIKNLIRCFNALFNAFRKHKISEAGPVKKMVTMALKFMDTFVFSGKNIMTAHEITIQSAWAKNIIIPIKKNKKIEAKTISDFFNDVQQFYKNIEVYVVKETDKDVINKIVRALKNYSTTPLPQYGLYSRSRFYRITSEGVTTVTDITIFGNEVFFKAVRKALNSLRKTKIGRQLIDTLKDKKFIIQPPSMSAIEREENGWFYAKNSAGSAIAFDPANKVIGDVSELQKEPWRQRSPVIGLYHELLHIYYKFNSLKIKSVSGKIEKKIVGGHTAIEESFIVGIDFFDKESQEYFNFSDIDLMKNKAAMLSENSFRREYAKLKGCEYYFVRPYYDKPDTKVTSKHFKFKVAN